VDFGNVLTALKSGGVSEQMRKWLVVKGFQSTARYDKVISGYLEKTNESA
jgi:phosphoribosylaminoimidazolecarboxamide formyltransferase/IMP cyclohydrolase